MTTRDLFLLLLLQPAAYAAQADTSSASAPATPAPAAASAPVLSGRPSDPSESEPLGRASVLEGRRVVGDDGKPLGEIVDYALDADGLAYALLDTDGEATGDLALIPHGRLDIRSGTQPLVFDGAIQSLPRTPAALPEGAR